MKIKRNELVLVNLDPVVGSEQGRMRPALVIQNDIGNDYSPTTIVAAITTKIFSKEFPTNVTIPSKNTKLDKDSTILLNQIRTMLSYFGITTSHIQLRKQPGRQFHGRFYIKGKENLRKFYKQFCFLYASEKQEVLEDLISRS